MRAAKLRARETGRTLTQLVEDALRAELLKFGPTLPVAEPLPTYRGKGLHPGVDVSDANALGDHMSWR